MMTMGTSVSLEVMKSRLKEPWGVIIAWVHQFLILPFIAFLICELTGINSIYAVALKIQAMCPGGATSNVSTFIGLADVPLSIACTSISTVSALFMMPFWIWVYLPNEESIDFSSTIGNIMIGLGIVVLGTGIGMYLVERRPEAAARLNRFGGPIMIAMIALVLLSGGESGESPVNPDEPGKTFFACTMIPGFALMSTLIVGTIVGIPKPQRLATAIETSAQNSVLAIALLYQIYDGADRDKAAVIPIIYAFGGGFFNVLTLVSGYMLGWSYADPKLSYCENMKIAREHMIDGTLPQRLSITSQDGEVDLGMIHETDAQNMQRMESPPETRM